MRSIVEVIEQIEAQVAEHADHFELSARLESIKESSAAVLAIFGDETT